MSVAREIYDQVGRTLYSTIQRRRDTARALGKPGEPAFVMPAIAAGFNEHEIESMQQQLSVADGSRRYLLAYRGTMPGETVFESYYPLREDSRVEERNWVFDIDTRTFNPKWRLRS